MQNSNKTTYTHEEIVAMCPQIKLYGWWWKRLFKKYRDQRMLMQEMLLTDWVQHHEHYFEALVDAIKNGAGAIIDREKFRVNHKYAGKDRV